MTNLLRLKFLPQSTDLALLLLRLWAGLTILLNHGWVKLGQFNSMVHKFPDVIGLGSEATFVLILFAEVLCAIGLVLGFFSRFSALVLTIAMATAFVQMHGTALGGPSSGELPFIYLACFATLLVAGPGRFSLDAKAGRA